MAARSFTLLVQSELFSGGNRKLKVSGASLEAVVEGLVRELGLGGQVSSNLTSRCSQRYTRLATACPVRSRLSGWS